MSEAIGSDGVSDGTGAGISMGAGAFGATLFTRTAFFLTAFFTAFLATGFALAFTLLTGLAAFFAAFLATFFATFFDLLDAFDLLGAFFFATFFFNTFDFAPVLFDFFTGRFFAFFFAMIDSPRGLTATRCESSPEKVRCHLRVTLESIEGIAYAAHVSNDEPIRPLHDVWLRPRRVFRELASRPVGMPDYILGAAQGMAGWLALSRAQNAGASSGLIDIFGKALLIGSIGGIVNLLLFGAIYVRLSARTGARARAVDPTTRTQVIHVLAYGGVPMVASLLVWILTALLTGEVTFEQTPHPEVEGFVALLLHMQFFAYVLLTVWSVVIQVMGLSEIQGLGTRKAFGQWVLGQIIGLLAVLFLVILIAVLFPNAVTS